MKCQNKKLPTKTILRKHYFHFIGEQIVRIPNWNLKVKLSVLYREVEKVKLIVGKPILVYWLTSKWYLVLKKRQNKKLATKTILRNIIFILLKRHNAQKRYLLGKYHNILKFLKRVFLWISKATRRTFLKSENSYSCCTSVPIKPFVKSRTFFYMTTVINTSFIDIKFIRNQIPGLGTEI